MKTAIVLIVMLAAVASGATYRGKSIDGKTFEGSLKGNGVIVPITVTFDGRKATVRDDKSFRTMTLESEEIEDLKYIPATDESGKDWIIRIESLE